MVTGRGRHRYGEARRDPSGRGKKERVRSVRGPRRRGGFGKNTVWGFRQQVGGYGPEGPAREHRRASEKNRHTISPREKRAHEATPSPIRETEKRRSVVVGSPRYDETAIRLLSNRTTHSREASAVRARIPCAPFAQ